ncbi:DNA mismatch repair endonuclease MutL [Jeotgalibacillus proteolyticus]|uniref:DNA mismatch repair protein MutL n=1 Tax=Jeotgalibacillus proteolyticus TaxID=2082395 RepID=A0A2S5GGE5_9BACL|nr:DNA mismatch repair endonuclease MutL [Jeotgalibacillus proteolyticus]PPA71985.1 DNA mismatch repair endonuclease MutL [Jeotgalibacillus proteolyticus]
MGRIHQLNESLANKIAAGEVVERPASVVKELVENAVDANATVIEIDLEEAGLSAIRIRDNGDGIETEDILLAFSRHATSKIQNEHDLFRIRTLGFRGEALPSISSVSKIEVTTSTGETGAYVKLEGGEVLEQKPAPLRKGTDIHITELFYNTPARLKYLKTINTELGNVTDIVNRLALSHPEISFRLRHNGKPLLKTNGKGDVIQVIASIYGVGMAKKMLPFKEESLDFKIEGWAALPEMTRASRNYISVLVNGRYIKNYAIARAIQAGYHTLLPIGRFPIVLLSIKMDPVLVDVNVHPSKQEVRFSKEQELIELITRVLKELFKQQSLIPGGEIKKPAKVRETSEQTQFTFDFQSQPVKASLPEAERLPFKEQEEELRGIEEVQEEKEAECFYARPDTEDAITVNEPPEKSQAPATAEIERVPSLDAIGQMHGTYILAQNENGLYIIDQHAAQERIKYEFFKEKVGQVEPELQELLMPLTLEYSTDDKIKILENKILLEDLGVFLEEFGRNGFIARSHPVWFPKGQEQEIIEDMIEQLLEMKKVSLKKLREEAAILMSCKKSIKANHYLRKEDMQQLLEDLRKTNDPFTCPHGRPIIIHYTTYEMEKMFKRVM